MSWYLAAIKKYATFSGRARRKEYWMFVLFSVIFGIVATILDNVLGTTFEVNEISSGMGYIYLVYCLFLIIPGLSVFVRRLHDQDKSGAWFFIYLIPLVGPIWILILMFTSGTVGANKYGDDPKAA